MTSLSDGKHLLFSLFLVVIVGIFTWGSGCGNKPSGEQKQESIASDGGSNKEGQPGKENNTPEPAPSGPIEISFEPASGAEIAVKDLCIVVKMSLPPGKLLKAELSLEGSSTPTAANFAYDPKDKTKTTAKACAYSLLTQGSKYTLNVEVRGKDKKTYKGTASYTTKKPFAEDPPPECRPRHQPPDRKDHHP